MTLKEFFRIARHRSWRVSEYGGYVTSGNYCPLGAVETEVHKPYVRYCRPSPGFAAERLGLPLKIAQRIATASDKRRSKYRPWLLKNLGLGSRGQEPK